MAEFHDERASLVPSKKIVHRSINIEMIRFFGHFFYFVLLMVGKVMTDHFVEWPVKGEPFDPTKTIIYEIFGFNHACNVLDFNPSKTVSAIVVVFCTIPLCLFVALNHYRMEHEFINGNIGPKLFKFNQIITPYQLIAFVYFYLVFVNSPHDRQSFVLHYIPYLMFQIGLVLNEIHQIEYLIARKDRELPTPKLIAKCPRILLRVFSVTLSVTLILSVAFVVSFVIGKPMVDTSTTSGLLFSQLLMLWFVVITLAVPLISSFFLINEKYGSSVEIELATVSTKRIGVVQQAERDEEAIATSIHMSRGRNPTQRVDITSSIRSMPRVHPRVVRPPLEGAHPAYPYKNVAFQGGGAKGVIYVGAVEALDQLGVLPYLKRFAGTSAGTIPALLLALGLDAKQVKFESDRVDLSTFFDGGSALSRGYNFTSKLGIHPGKKATECIGEILEKYTGDADLTFRGLYYRFGTELCITVSNITRHQSEYCHVNTTPELKIKSAIRASMSLPFLWEPTELIAGEKYVDGGLFNNFPLKAFDGWFLSTRPEDGLLQKVLQANPSLLTHGIEPSVAIKAINEILPTSFVEPNMATIGFRVSSDSSPDQAKYSSHLSDLQKRLSVTSYAELTTNRNEEIPLPDTKRARTYLKKKNAKRQGLLDGPKYEHAHVEMLCWMLEHWARMAAHQEDVHPHGILSIVLIRNLKEFPPREQFCPEVLGLFSWDEVVEVLDFDGKGYITRADMGKFWEKYGVRNAYMKNREPKTIDSKTSLAVEILESMYNVFEENLLRDPNNAVRICSLNTHYVNLLDINLQQGDKEFLYKLGKRATIEWIQKTAQEMNASYP